MRQKSLTKAEHEILRTCQEKIGYTFNHPHLLLQALTHPSYVGESALTSYQRLEFLGDSILGAVISIELYQRFPDAQEGSLTQSKIGLVSGRSLSRMADQLGLASCLFIGNSESCDNYRGLTRALEDVFEAIVGAIYLDAGFERVRSWVLAQMDNYIDTSLETQALADPKSHLQALLQSSFKKAPIYEVIAQDGPAHNPCFTSAVLLDETVLGVGSGSSKKLSQAQAALCALEHLSQHDGALIPYESPKE